MTSRASQGTGAADAAARAGGAGDNAEPPVPQGVILQTLAEGVAVLKDRKYVWVNRAMSEISGYAEHEMLGNTTGIMYASESEYERVGKDAYAAMCGGGVYEDEILIRCKNRETRWVRVKGRPLDAADPGKGSIWIMGDINERTQLRKADAILQTILNYLPSGVSIFGPDMQMIQCNQKFRELLAYPQALFDDGPPSLAKLFHYEARRGDFGPGDPEVLVAAAMDGARRAVPAVLERRLPDGTVLEIRGNTLPGGGFIRIYTDISERKRAEAEIRTLNDSLELKVKERTRELERSNEELHAFAYSVAHDLRSPLRGINGFSAILAAEYADKLDATALGYLRRIQSAINRMAQVMDDLLALAHAGNAELHRREVDLSAMVQAVAGALQGADPARRVEFSIAPGVVVEADPGLMRIVLDNLLSNAWKFTRDTQGAKIEFGLAATEGGPACFVRDNGAGFDPAFSDKLFRQFQRLHTNKEFEGNGVGLAIVERVIRRHEGRVWAEGAPGRGATFYFTLDQSGPDSGATAREPADGADPPSAASPPR